MIEIDQRNASKAVQYNAKMAQLEQKNKVLQQQLK